MSHPGDTALKNTPITVPRSSTGSIITQTFKSTSGLQVCSTSQRSESAVQRSESADQRSAVQRSAVQPHPKAPFSWPRALASSWFTTLPPPTNKCVWVRTTNRQYPLSHAPANIITSTNTTLHPPAMLVHEKGQIRK